MSAKTAAEELDHFSPTPLYVQLEHIFRQKIAFGAWGPGDKIPSENDFNTIYGVSRMTVRGVLTKLVDDGLLVRVAGKGTFVAQRKIQTKSPAYQGFREQLEQAGFQTTTLVLATTTQNPSKSVREHLHLSSGENVTVIERLRLADGVPVSLHYSYVPLKLAPALEQFDTSREQLCVILADHYGLAMKHVEERLESVGASAEVAKHLQVSQGEPLLHLEDIISDSSKTPFEYSRILFRGDRVQLESAFDL